MYGQVPYEAMGQWLGGNRTKVLNHGPKMDMAVTVPDRISSVATKSFCKMEVVVSIAGIPVRADDWVRTGNGYLAARGSDTCRTHFH